MYQNANLWWYQGRETTTEDKAHLDDTLRIISISTMIIQSNVRQKQDIRCWLDVRYGLRESIAISLGG